MIVLLHLYEFSIFYLSKLEICLISLVCHPIIPFWQKRNFMSPQSSIYGMNTTSVSQNIFFMPLTLIIWNIISGLSNLKYLANSKRGNRPAICTLVDSSTVGSLFDYRLCRPTADSTISWYSECFVVSFNYFLFCIVHLHNEWF